MLYDFMLSILLASFAAMGIQASRTKEGKKAHGAVEACRTDRERSDQLSGRFNEN